MLKQQTNDDNNATNNNYSNGNRNSNVKSNCNCNNNMNNTNQILQTKKLHGKIIHPGKKRLQLCLNSYMII